LLVLDAGMMGHMPATQKITVELPAELMQQARAVSGAGVSETVREALQEFVSRRAQLGLLALRGKVKIGLDLETLREDR